MYREIKRVVRLGLLSLCLFSFFVLTGCSKPVEKKEPDDIVFGYDLPKDNCYIYVKDPHKLLEEAKNIKDDEVYYFMLSKSSCPWCIQYAPLYNEVATKYNIKIHVFEPKMFAGVTFDKDDNFTYDYTDYKMIIDYILSSENAIEDKYILNKKTKNELTGNEIEVPWLYVPFTYKVKNGKIVDCLKELESHVVVDKKLPNLSQEQKEEYMKIIDDFFKM